MKWSQSKISESKNVFCLNGNSNNYSGNEDVSICLLILIVSWSKSLNTF